MPLIATRGASSVQGFGQFAQTSVNYIEDVFSTYLYTGTGANRSITNGIDLSTKGGMVWIKSRSDAVNHDIFDTNRGAGHLSWITTAAESYTTDTQKTLTAFNTDGFSLGDDAGAWGANSSGYTFASWTFRKQPKFFDVVTYTGTGSNTTIAHNLGSVPGCIIVKRTNTTGAWQVYHRSLANTEYLVLNDTAAKATGATRWNSTTPTSSVFSVGTDATVNASGSTYVAYVFASNAGGFGLTGSDNVITCSSFTTDGSGNATVNLGYEPQWLVMKGTTAGQPWWEVNNMSGFVASPGTTTKYLVVDTQAAEADWGSVMAPTATGFVATGLAASTAYVYIAIRRGPMKVPTTGTSVYNATTGSAYGNPETVSVGFAPDLTLINRRTGTGGHYFVDRLRGGPKYFTITSMAAEADDGANKVTFDTQNSATVGGIFGAPYSGIFWFMRRAPSFFDEVCYTGTGVATTFSHNLSVVPEIIICKARDLASRDWNVYASPLGNTKYLRLNGTFASADATTAWNSTTPTSSVFTLGTSTDVNASGYTFVAYLFATCAGVSKVGSYTGTATTLQIDCGFTGGARFVLIKRTDSTGDWYVWDSARGIIAGNDPYLLLNSTAVEVTNTDYIDTYNAGFELSSTAPAAINASGGTYIFLAIA
jgi:hypothetical protein